MNERKELIARLRLDYTASKLALSLMKQAADMLEADSELCRKLALEEAVKVCEAIEREHLDTYKHKPGPNAYDPHFQGLSMGAGECADKIKELMR